tara:strand:+ start:840 stop:1034 length:195 start_codon:yes stop_codon:yes gene_type:complete
MGYYLVLECNDLEKNLTRGLFRDSFCFCLFDRFDAACANAYAHPIDFFVLKIYVLSLDGADVGF